MDFPFGVPAEFAAHLAPKPPLRAMPDLWKIASGMTAGEFLEARGRFVAAHGELKRSGDTRHFPESYSPLHVANPNMVPMTYEGIRLLHRWHENDPRRWHVPPLEPPPRPAQTVTLLELMPGAFLKAVGLPYKGYKKGRRSAELREKITGTLARASGIPLPDLDAIRMGCHASDDFLDAVVAAVGAACWAQGTNRFRQPQPDELALASPGRLDLRSVPVVVHVPSMLARGRRQQRTAEPRPGRARPFGRACHPSLPQMANCEVESWR